MITPGCDHLELARGAVMRQLILALAFCASLIGSAFAQGGMGPGPGTVHSTGGGAALVALSNNAGATVQTNGSGIATFSSISFGTAASDRIIVVGASCACSSNPGNDSAMTIGGVSATLAVASNGSVGGLGGRYAEFWYASVPTGTSGNIVITNPNNFVFLGIVVYGVTGVTTTPTIAVVHQDATSGSPPQALPSLAVPTNGVGIGLVYNDTVLTSPSFTIGTGDFSFNNGGGAFGALEMDSAHTTAVGSIAFTLGGSGGNNWAGAGVALSH